MTIKGWVIGLGIMAGLICKGLAQVPPSNDNYTNRTILSGTDVTFSGTLTGATIETTQESALFNYYYGTAPTKSVWWAWTAPVSTDLTVQLVGSSLGEATNQGAAMLTVYTQTNTDTMPTGLVVVSNQPIDFRLVPATISMSVKAGSNYLIQLIGTNSASYSFRMVATNTPVIAQQPETQTVYANASALFYVVAAGTAQKNFGYQWYFNGNSINGETAPMLALTNIDSTMAGTYTVAVSNAAGVTMSQPAGLAVSTSNMPIILGAMPAANGNFGFSLTGESGRKYCIQASGDGVIWTNALYFPLDAFSQTGTSVVWNTNSRTLLSITNDAPRKFFRALPYILPDPATELCVNNLRKIRVAKMLCQRDYGFYPTSYPTVSQILPYLPHQTELYCPYDVFKTMATSYIILMVQGEPECEIRTNHISDDPR